MKGSRRKIMRQIRVKYDIEVSKKRVILKQGKVNRR